MKDITLLQLKDKKALVIGGSRSIGAAIVRRLSSEGASVTFTYASSDDAAAALASEVGGVAVKADSADRNAVIAHVKAAGALDILVVNSAAFEFGEPLTQDPDLIDRMFRINIHAPYHASVEAARQMLDGGRIILIGSVTADRTGFPGVAAYSVTKNALHGIARGLARDLGDRGITVNVIQPGATDTDSNPATGPIADTLRSFMAIKRYGRPDEIAGMVAYLTGPEAGWITGAIHTIDGGFAA
jgi:cyclic-di-GMP-binding biofilm dispersal mediator protein